MRKALTSLLAYKFIFLFVIYNVITYIFKNGKKAKIIATLGPSIYKETELKKIIEIGVDAFRINFSHDTRNIEKVIKKIRNIEK